MIYLHPCGLRCCRILSGELGPFGGEKPTPVVLLITLAALKLLSSPEHRRICTALAIPLLVNQPYPVFPGSPILPVPNDISGQIPYVF